MYTIGGGTGTGDVCFGGVGTSGDRGDGGDSSVWDDCSCVHGVLFEGGRICPGKRVVFGEESTLADIDLVICALISRIRT